MWNLLVKSFWWGMFLCLTLLFGQVCVTSNLTQKSDDELAASRAQAKVFAIQDAERAILYADKN